MQSPTFTVHQLRKSYPTNGTNQTVIAGLDLTIREGEYTIIMGSSGSGKSTLLYMLSGLDHATEGEIWLYDQAVHQKSEKELAMIRRQYLGFVFQSSNLVPNLSVLENLLIPGFLVPGNRKKIRQRALELIRAADLEGLEDRRPSQLSGGQQQRAAIIRGLINNPKVLLADEPTGNLNSASSQAILDLLSGFHQGGQTILLVTHDIKTACRGQRVLYFKDGNIVAELCFDPTMTTSEEKERLLTDWLLEKGW